MSSVGSASRVIWRLRRDYGSRSRIGEYAAILRRARDAGYALISLGDFVTSLRSGDAIPTCLILRHDVDISHVSGNEAFFRAEIENDARATYYFRLSTAASHTALIRRLLSAGFEVGYQFEEGATFAKRAHLRSRADVFRHREEIVAAFRRNCALIRETWSPTLRSASSHGDWINRKLGFLNNELIDRQVMGDCGLEFEAYDPEVKGAADVYLSDAVSAPQEWAADVSPLDAMRQGRRRIYMLTHERQWHPGVLAKASADVIRVQDALRFRLGF